MIIKHLALHQIIREDNNIPSLNLSDHLLDTTNSTVIDFIESLIKNFSKKGPTYGRFEEDIVNYPFQNHVEEFIESNEFLDFSINAMNILKSKIQVPKATGGYVIFINYNQGHNDFLVTAMLNKSAEFSVDDKNLDIKKLEILAIDKLARANRLNITKWKLNNEETYLAFIKGTRQVSDYFQKFIGNTDLTSSTINSKNLNNALKKYMRQEKFSEDEKSNKNKEIHTYLEKKRINDEDVSLSSISAIINSEEPDKFSNFIKENEELEVSSVFRLGKKKDTNYFCKTHLEEQGYKLEFEKSLKKQKKIIREGNNIIIKNVPLEFLDDEFGVEDEQNKSR